MRAGKHTGTTQDGFTYVVMLTALAIFGIGLAALGESWSAASRREREEELLQVGAAYARAIERYYLASPGSLRRYPRSLDELVEDRRFVGTVRYLRRLYPDPTVRAGTWGLVPAPDGGIMGIHSLNPERPLRRQGSTVNGLFVQGERYADWRFVYSPVNEKK